MKKPHVIIIGGGASGLMAAIVAAREGATVTLIEQKDRVGKKILSTGNGRCNLTNSNMTKECFRGDDTSIVSNVLKQFDEKDTLRFFEELGVILKERQGYFYPISDQAGTILDVLRMEIENLKIETVLEQKVTQVEKKDHAFYVKTSSSSYVGDAVILATGGCAAPILGSDGSGYDLAKSFGHRLSPVVPALVQLVGKGDFFKQIAGVRTQAKVSLYVENYLAGCDTGELQLTDYGISGIPVFQISRFAAKGLYAKKKVIAEIDFLPTMNEKDFSTYFMERLRVHGWKTAESFLIGMFHKKIIQMLLKKANIPVSQVMQTIDKERLQVFLDLCKHFKLEIVGTKGFEQAQVCAGGILTKEVNPETLESIYEKNLYFTGELLDIDGICGGYNLQWAWSTGFIAGKSAAKGK